MQIAGYSGTPLVNKLGIKPGHLLYLKNPPANYQSLIAPIPEGVIIAKRLRPNLDMVHFFTDSKKQLMSGIRLLKTKIKQDGMIWVSWPKKSSGVPTDITEDTIREVILPMGLVDIKVCAVDDVWSALKLVIRKENRTR